MTMLLRDAVSVVHELRTAHDVVISSMGTAREWMQLGALHPLDFVLVPSAMGHATSMALGLALAQPNRRIIVLSGDGSLLMNLGNLVTIAAERPRNLTVLVFVNGVYEITGAQAVPGGANVDFAGLARAAGIEIVQHFADIADWRARASGVLRATDLTVGILDVAPVSGARGPRSPGPAGERAQAFMDALLAGKRT